MNPTDPTRAPSAADDEVVSAVMDGEGTPAEVSRVESDPALTSRMAELRAVREATRTTLDPKSLDATVRARLVGRVMAEVEPPPAVVPLARHRRRPTAGPWVIGAAAAVLVVVVATIAVTYRGSTDSDDAGNDMASSAAESDAAATTTIPAGSAEAATPSSTAMASMLPPPHIGSFPDVASLRDAFAATPPAVEDSGRIGGPCAASIPPGSVVVATATVGGRAVIVATQPGVDASPLVIDAATCTGSG